MIVFQYFLNIDTQMKLMLNQIYIGVLMLNLKLKYHNKKD